MYLNLDQLQLDHKHTEAEKQTQSIHIFDDTRNF